MSKKINDIRKSTIIATLFLSLLTIITVIIYLINYMKDKGFAKHNLLGNPTWVVAAIIILLAFGASAFALFRGLWKNANVAKLNDEYEVVFEQITQYVGLSGLTFFEKRELNDEILNLFLEAQKAKKTVDKVIGTDYQSFADNLIGAYGVKNYLIHDFLSSLQYLIFYLIAGQYMMSLKYPGNYFNGKMDYTTILFFVLISFTIMPILNTSKRNMIKGKFNSPVNVNSYLKAMLSPMIIFPILITGSFIACIEILTRFFHQISWVSYFLYEGTVIISSPLILVLLLMFVAFLYYLKRKLRRV